MWLLTTSGFLSVVRGRRPGTVQVRARRRSDLEGLRRRFRLAGRIAETPRADYPFRVVVATARWRRMAAALAGDAAGYPNFKAALAAREGARSPRVDAAHEIWAVLRELQDVESGRGARPGWLSQPAPAPAIAAAASGRAAHFVPRMTGPTDAPWED